jgi:hypothetical protein
MGTQRRSIFLAGVFLAAILLSDGLVVALVQVDRLKVLGEIGLTLGLSMFVVAPFVRFGLSFWRKRVGAGFTNLVSAFFGIGMTVAIAVMVVKSFSDIRNLQFIAVPIAVLFACLSFRMSELEKEHSGPKRREN